MTKSLISLHKKAWKLMSEWVRRREVNRRGYGSCFTCGAKVHWRKANAGHYIHRKSLDFDIINIQRQCVYCNLRLHGNSGRFAYQIIKQYGENTLDDLESRRHKDVKIKRDELDQIIRGLEVKISLLN